MTDIERIVDYLSRGNSLTVLEAFETLHMNDFRARVSEARRRGIKICDEWFYTENGKRVKRYFMRSEN